MANKKSHLLRDSTTFIIAAKAAQREKLGLPVYNLSIGEPNFPVPKHIKEASIQAIEEDFTNYTATAGITELKEAIVFKLKRDQKIDFELSEVMATAGGKQALFNIFQVLLNPGDEVLLTDPAWLSYEVQILWSDGVPVKIPLSAENDFTLTAGLVEKHITPKTKVLIINSPANPTGAVIPTEELIKIAELAKKHKLFLILDDVYEHLYYTAQKPEHLLEVAPELKNQSIIINSISKSYAMTGWRLGFAAGPKELIQKMTMLQSQSTSNPCSVAQKAAIAALRGDLEFTEYMRTSLAENRSLLLEGLRNTEFSWAEPKGAFYLMLNVKNKLLKDETDLEFCERYLEKGLAMIPGSAFGKQTESWVRLSFASSKQTLQKALEILQN